MKYLLLTVSMVAAVIGQLLLKNGVLSSSLNFNLPSIARTIFSPLVLSGFIVYGISAVIWLFILQRFPLSVAYPALSLTYVAIVMISVLVLNEPFTTSKIVGIALIILGVFFLFR